MEKLLKHKKRKVAPKREPKEEAKEFVLVGTYKDKQLAWIKQHGVYNYPIKEEDELKPESCAMVKELWLYASATAKRYCFSAEFVGIQSKEEFLAANPTYAKAVGPSKHTRYMVFKTSFLDYGPRLEGATVFARVSDFEKGRGRTKKIAAAIKQYRAGGELGSLAAYLPSDLAKLPHEQLRVCEVAVQMDFFSVMGDCVGVSVPFPPLENPKFTFVDLFAGIGGFHLAMHELGGKCVFASEWDKDAQITYAANYGIAPKGDITKIKETDIPRHDVLCAGFPCQAFSKAGKQLGFADETKGTLFFDVERILKHYKIMRRAA